MHRRKLLGDGVMLSEPEYDTLCGYAEGLETDEIARRMGKATDAVHKYRNTLYETFGVADRAPMSRVYALIIQAWRRKVLRTCPVCRRHQARDKSIQELYEERRNKPLLRQHPPAQVQLTEQRLRILRLAARGMTNAEIGREIFVTESTVKTQIVHICRKWGARDRTHMVAIGFACGQLTAADLPAQEQSGDRRGEPGPDDGAARQG